MRRALAWDSIQIHGSIVVGISACHADNPGSIPGCGVGSELMTFGIRHQQVTSCAVAARVHSLVLFRIFSKPPMGAESGTFSVQGFRSATEP